MTAYYNEIDKRSAKRGSVIAAADEAMTA